MEFYLIKNQTVKFTGEEGEGTKESDPITIDLKPVVENSEDAKSYRRALANALIEISDAWKHTLNVKSYWAMEPTFIVQLTNSSSGHGSMKICADLGITRNSVFNRLYIVYEDEVTVHISITKDGVENVCFDVKDLPISIIDYGEDRDDISDFSGKDFGCEFYQVDFPNQTWTPWTDENTAQFEMTVTLVLSGKAVDQLYRESFTKAGLTDEFKTLLEAIPTDFVIIADNGAMIKCHSSALAVRSNVFETMLQSQMKEGSSKTLKLPDMSEAGVRAFLAFIYYWSLEDAVKDCEIALELLRAGHKYNISKLQDAMSVLIGAKPTEWFTVGMVVRFFLFARSLDEKDGKDKFLNKVVQVLKWYEKTSSETLLASEDYQQLFQKNPKDAMELSSLFLKFGNSGSN